jgi:eukaryotic-like serine/threonine-protein kinase
MIGETISHYRIVSSLGAGGMGQVYLAEDARLDRKVALKLLARGAVDDVSRSRFAQEARAASALNHPNIVTIYDIGSEQGRDFIAMEYVDGHSLRGLVSQGRVEIKKALSWMAQAADALAAAHDKGIVHRDIKPENLMINRASQIKILDFGLAKLVEQSQAPASAESATTVAEDFTRPGTLLGSTPYMSPEQAQGLPLDHRTDIFSLGLVLYELLTGERAFRGKSTLDTLHAIIHTEPRAAVERNPRLPPETMEILGKALAKDRAERYRHAGDFVLDLQRLKRRIESGVAGQGEPSRQFRLPVWMRWGLAALIAFSLGVAWWLGRAGAGPAVSPTLANVTLAPLTTDPGLEEHPTLSPDGETVAYMSDRTGNFEIFLRQISGGPEVNLSNDPSDDIQPAFSPNGKQIAFVSSRSGSPAILFHGTDTPLMGGAIWVTSALGGATRRIAETGNFPSWSPDGSHLLYTAGTWFRSKIYRVPAAGGEPQEIPVQFQASEGPFQFLMYPSYSADNQWITFEATGNNIYVVEARGGLARRIARGRRPVMGPDSREILYSNAEPGRNYSLWRLPFSASTGTASAAAEPLTVGRGRDLPVSVSRDGKRVAFVALAESFNLEIMPFDAEGTGPKGPPRPITSGAQSIYFMSFSPDARSVTFESRRAASRHIWRADLGSAPVPLTSDPTANDQGPRWSPDGTMIAFVRSRSTELAGGLWLMAADGANPRLLIERGGNCRWMPDSRALIYASDGALHLFDLAAKKTRQLTREPNVMPIFEVSQDAKWVVFQSTTRGNIDLHAISIEGGDSRSVVSTPHHDYHPFFSPKGQWLYFLLDHKNLYRVPGPGQNWRPGMPEKITNFPESGLLLEDPQTSRDGRQLLYSRGNLSGDIWVLNR